jgi:hypothetical protein
VGASRSFRQKAIALPEVTGGFIRDMYAFHAEGNRRGQRRESGSHDFAVRIGVLVSRANAFIADPYRLRQANSPDIA